MDDRPSLPSGYDIDKVIQQSQQQALTANDDTRESLPAGYHLPGTEPSIYEKDWGAAPLSEVAASAVKEFLPSVGRGIAAIPQAIINYDQTGEALKQAGQGALSKAQGIFYQQDPEKKAQDEAVFNAMVEPFTSVAGFKKALATDPFSVLSLAAIPVSGGASAAGTVAKTIGTASAAAKAAYVPLKVAEYLGKTAATVMDPISGTANVAGKLYDVAGQPILKSLAAGSSSVPKASLDLAYQSGKTADPVIANTFNKFAKGEGDALEFSRTVSNASSKLRDAEISEWASDKANVLSLKQNVAPDPILKAINDARIMAGDPNLGIGPAKVANQQIDQLDNLIKNRFSLPEGSPGRTLEGFDLLKRELYEMGENTGGMQSDVIKKINSGVRQAMSDVSPEYVNLMEKYQLLNDKMKTIQKTLATGDNVSAVRELNTFIRGMDDTTKNQFISELAKYDKRIPYMVAGASIHQAAGTPSKWAQVLSQGQIAAMGGGLAVAVQTGNFLPLLGATAISAGKNLFGNPYAVSDIAQTAGKISKSAENMPAGVAQGAEAARRAGTIGLSRAQNEELVDQQRQGRKSGGRISDRLVMAADRAKKNINSNTESLLNVPDTHVAQALELANKYL